MTEQSTPDGAGPPGPEDQRRLAERRMLEEIARHRRVERRQITRLRWGCLGVVAGLVFLLILLALLG